MTRSPDADAPRWSSPTPIALPTERSAAASPERTAQRVGSTPTPLLGRHRAQRYETPLSAVRAAQIMANRFATDHDERDDIAATALLGLLEYADRHDIDPHAALAEPNWRLLQCRAIDRLRKQRRRRLGLRAWATDQVEPRQETAPLRNHIDVQRAVRRVGERLNTGEQRLIHDVYVEGHTLADVARGEGWSHGTVRRRHKRAIAVLRRSLGA